MQAVGRIGSYISRSVYTVSAPFHPFGGAVDIIAVLQPDGTYKSNPWYVRFGKFQGVLKTREKVVTISVNGIEADFHMYLNHKGEAYFLTEVDEGDGDPVCSPPSSSGLDADRAVGNRTPLKSISCNYDSGCAENVKSVVASTNSSPLHIFGLIFGKKTTRDEENELEVFKKESSDSAEIAVDLLDLKWTTNLDSPMSKKNNKSNNNDIKNASLLSGVSKDEVDGNLVSRSRYIVETEERVSISGESVLTEYSQLVSIRQTKEQVGDEILIENRESRIFEEGQLLFSNLDGINKPYDAKYCSGFSLDQSVINNYIADVDSQSRLKSVSSEPCIKEAGNVEPEGVPKIVSSLPIMGPLNHKLEVARENQSLGARTTCEDVKILDKSNEKNAEPCIGTHSRPIDSLHERRRSWPFPFQRSKSIKASQEDSNGVENPNAIDKDSPEVKVNKKTFIRTLTPTSKQLASLNLKEGKNIIVFTFQTAMLGKQQVDARIFMWRWDTRIVISDVDGTITRSDLLGQVMPLVGMDWSQTGVAHLFSAIKENGYQLLFLSARSIAQSFITRQFLLNIKQDGIALPDGPVVISPDGLFPSLYREVVRRAPHEFKIACLEDIKALFPAGTNPFYAGFGNRDTDEFSYLKVGIPRGKIFIINPKGEIAVNRRVETKSYVSLHALVHGMFPTMSSAEQEDFNSWNYWKIRPPVDEY